MQLSYDPRRNIAYLRVREAAGTQVETVRLSDEVNVDLPRTDPFTSSSFSTPMLSYAPLMADDLCWWTNSRVVGLRFHYPTSPERHNTPAPGVPT